MLVRIITAGLSSLFFGIIFNIRRENLFYAMLGGALAVALNDISLHFYVNVYAATFFAASGLALYSEIMARVRKTTVTTFIISALIPLVPGGGMYQTMLALVETDTQRAFSIGFQTLCVAGLLAFGIIFSSSLFKLCLPRKKI